MGDFVYAGSEIVSPCKFCPLSSPQDALLIRVKDVRVQWLDLDGSFSVDGVISDSILRNTTNTTKPGFTGDAFWTEYVNVSLRKRHHVYLLR